MSPSAGLGSGECKAAGSEGPETYVAGHFEDHARLRTGSLGEKCDRLELVPPFTLLRVGCLVCFYEVAELLGKSFL